MQYSFDVQEALDYGVDEAIMIWNLRFCILKNKANGKHFYEGRTWTYNTNEAFQKLFPFWKKGAIERLLIRMLEKNIIVKGNFNTNKYDRTCWYAFFDETKFLAPHLVIAHFSETGNGFPENKKSTSQNQEMDLAKTGNGFGENGKSNTDIKPNLKPNLLSPDQVKWKKLKERKGYDFEIDVKDAREWYDDQGNMKISFDNFLKTWAEKPGNQIKKTTTSKTTSEQPEESPEIKDMKAQLKFLISNKVRPEATQLFNLHSIKKTDSGFSVVADKRALEFQEILNEINLKIILKSS